MADSTVPKPRPPGKPKRGGDVDPGWRMNPGSGKPPIKKATPAPKYSAPTTRMVDRGAPVTKTPPPPKPMTRVARVREAIASRAKAKGLKPTRSSIEATYRRYYDASGNRQKPSKAAGSARARPMAGQPPRPIMPATKRTMPKRKAY